MAAINFTLRGGISDSAGGLKFASQYGSSTDVPKGRYSLLDGTGAGQVDQIAIVSFSITNSTTVAYDLRSGIKDILNADLVLSKLRFVHIELDAAVAGDVWFGPMNQTNAIQAWFNGTGANDRMRIRRTLILDEPAGFTVDSTHKVLAITNSSGATITGKMVIAG